MRPRQLCAYCGRPIPEGKKASARFCGDACRQRYSRQQRRMRAMSEGSEPDSRSNAVLGDEDAARMLAELAMNAVAIRGASKDAPPRMRPILRRIADGVLSLLVAEGVLEDE